MRAKKSPDLISATGLIQLMTHTLMGTALGLGFGLALILCNPTVASLIDHGGSQATIVFALTLVMTFAIGATLTGIVFILVENKKF